MNRTLIFLSKASVAFLGLGCILLMVLLPAEANSTGQMYPEVADVVVPYSVASVLVAACGVAATVAVWQLITSIGSGAISSTATRRWVDVLGISISTALALIAAVSLHLLVVKMIGGPGIVLLLLASTAALIATSTVTIILRNSFNMSNSDHRVAVSHL